MESTPVSLRIEEAAILVAILAFVVFMVILYQVIKSAVQNAMMDYDEHAARRRPVPHAPPVSPVVNWDRGSGAPPEFPTSSPTVTGV